MEIKDFTLKLLERVHFYVHLTLDGMTSEQLAYRPDPEANSIAWIIWHLTRGLDRRVSILDGARQTWIKDRVYEKFDLPPNSDDFGVGHDAEQVASVRPSDPSYLVNYYDSVYDRIQGFLKTLSATDIKRTIINPSNDESSTVGGILVDALNGNLVHVGQAAYVRGLIERRHWFPR